MAKRCKDCIWWKIIWAHGHTFAFEGSIFERMVRIKKRKNFSGECKPWMGMENNNARRCKNYVRKWYKFGREKSRQAMITEKRKREAFVIPTVPQINGYCREKNIYVDAEDFIQFYGMKGWMVGKNKMKCWEMAVCRAAKWEINRFNQPSPEPSETDKIEKIKREKQKARDDWERYLRSKTTAALRDLLKDKKSGVYYFASWLIKEILAERAKK